MDKGLLFENLNQDIICNIMPQYSSRSSNFCTDLFLASKLIQKVCDKFKCSWEYNRGGGVREVIIKDIEQNEVIKIAITDEPTPFAMSLAAFETFQKLN